MSNVYFVGDLHFGHTNVHKFRKNCEEMKFENETHHREFVMDMWQSTIVKRDKIFVLGDACFTMDAIPDIQKLNGTKILVRGNHDNLNTSVYLKAFKEVEGICRYKNAWLTHAPIHPLELRGKINIHGHVHFATVPDDRYENVCLENIGFKPISWQQIIEKREKRKEEGENE